MSSSPTVITLHEVHKAYRIWNHPGARLTTPLLEAAARRLPGAARLAQRAASTYRDFWALRNVSFELRRGESVGVIGRNGSGKSTLLQIIAGTLQPSSGRVQVAGRVAALLELGSGFNPEFTGRENVFLNGAILGLSQAEMNAKFDGIAAFADIGDFLDQPIKTYSSGMMMRLAFAVQTAAEPEVLIVDEALSVGDVFFQQKCAQRMRDLRDRGTTMLLVSHDMGVIRNMCSRALYLRRGSCVFVGDTLAAIQRYHSEAEEGAAGSWGGGTAAGENEDDGAGLRQLQRDALWRNPDTRDDAPRILAVALRARDGTPVTTARLDDPLVVEFALAAPARCAVHLAALLKNRYDQIVACLNTYTAGNEPVILEPGTVTLVRMEFDARLEAGEYTIQASAGTDIGRANRSQELVSTPWLGPLTLQWDYENDRAPFLGMVGLPQRIVVTRTTRLETF